MGVACRGVRRVLPRTGFLFLGGVNEAGEALPLPALPVKAVALRPYENYFLVDV